MKIRTSEAEFNQLWELYNNTRKGTKEVSVPKETLFNLLTDHGNLWAATEKGSSNGTLSKSG